MPFPSMLKNTNGADRLVLKPYLLLEISIAQQNYLMKSGASSRWICMVLSERNMVNIESKLKT